MEKAIDISDYELERGKPMPSKLHSRLQTNILVYLVNNYQEKYDIFSELSLSLDGWDSVPDICIYEKTEIDYQNDEIELTTPPLCAIEIVSPSQSINELILKAGKYFDKQVKSCWLVIPMLKNIYVFTNRENYEVYKSTQTLLDTPLNISLNLSEIFK
jgi:Uma2 family endonuclease